MVKLLGISGSLRAGSYNSMLVAEAARVFAPDEFSFADLRLPLYDGDLEARGMPDAVVALCDQIRTADAIVISTPEYNKNPSGVLKNALDWASRPPDQALRGKPVALIGATPGGFGTRSAQFQIRQILGNPGCAVLAKPELWVSGASEKFNEAGDLTDDDVRQELSDVLSAFRSWIVLTAQS